MTDPYLEELAAATEALDTARRRRYGALSAALSLLAIPNTPWRLRPVCHHLRCPG